MDLYLDATGAYYCPNGDGNAHLAVAATGDLYAVLGPPPEVGWQDKSALQVAEAVAGMPKV